MILTIDIPNNTDGQTLLDGICAASGWTLASGKTKATWTKEKVIEHIRITATRGGHRVNALATSTAIDAIVIT